MEIFKEISIKNKCLFENKFLTFLVFNVFVVFDKNEATFELI